jgi:hypothetical protein
MTDPYPQRESSVTIPDSVLRPNGSGAFTVEFRMYPKRLPYNGSALYLFRFAQGAVGNSASEWSIYYRTDLGGFPQFFGPNGQLVLTSSAWSSKMSLGTWHLIKITVATSGFTSVYVDDMANPAATSPTSPGYSGQNWILSFGDFVGCIDEVRISKGLR